MRWWPEYTYGSDRMFNHTSYQLNDAIFGSYSYMMDGHIHNLIRPLRYNVRIGKAPAKLEFAYY